MNTLIRLPFYAKTSLFLIGLYIFTSILFIAQDIILPLIYATIIAISISPGVNFLVRKKINRTLAIFAVLILALLLIVAFVLLIATQASLMGQAWPQLLDKFESLLNEGIAWASGSFDISILQINTWIAKSKAELLNNSSAAIGLTLTTMSGVLASIFLTPVYIFMILYYQPHLIEFTHRFFGVHNDNRVSEILSETKGIIQGYLVGLFAEFAIVAVLNTLGLLVLGMQYAILLGILGALLNIIPYLGGIIAMALFAAIALVTKSPVYVLYVITLYSLIQFIDNNYIVPKIVGSKVKLNALVSIIVVIVGAALWGIPGMFLSIPLTAVVKLILDRIESWKPCGFLLGDTMPPLVKLDLKFKKKTTKKSE
ncbi:AI-2E family transporter [Haliscomenobacter sp.]|uniref:AI-2E family transporter n=1 Tax=Haliscomenobacter sp. TaxID=2717303 RepID=UPI003593E4E4